MLELELEMRRGRRVPSGMRHGLLRHGFRVELRQEGVGDEK